MKTMMRWKISISQRFCKGGDGMDYLKEFGIEYTDPELQYMNADFEAHDIVPAEYIKVSGFP